MKIFRNTHEFHIENFLMGNAGSFGFDLSEALFFDIETTGFSAAHTRLYLIGCLYFDKTDGLFHTIQWFLDDIRDEAKLITSFFDFSKSFTRLIHFNGDGFDIPYIKSKCAQLSIDDILSSFTSIDLYKIAHSLKYVLKLPNLKQKSIEAFLGIQREDKYSGDKLIRVYEDYLKTKSDASLALLVLHNLDDIKGLLNLLSLFYYKKLFDGDFAFHSINLEENEAIIEAVLPYSLPSRISAGSDVFYMTAFGNKAKIKIDIYTNELKYFYPNYRDYYYLPEEDLSIHKSVAFYVDKNFRTRAKAANCYSKKTGRFLPQNSEIISPYFKIEYHDKTTYFELTDDFLKDPSSIKAYACHVLNILLLN